MAKEKEKKSKTGRIIRKGVLGFIAIFLLGTAGLFLYVSNNLPPLSDIENPQLDLSTRLFTADGEVLGTFHHKENRVYIPLEKMSPWVSAALVATEDIRFYSHSGIDPLTPFTILKDLIIHQRLRGGSGLPQQLARNLYNQVGKDNSLTRKVKEAIVAVELEARFTKAEIMQAYLNTTTFYGQTFGIEMGAQTLFSKSAADLELHEAALMIGLLKNPTYFSPTRNAKRARNRRNTVLDQMAKYVEDLNEHFPELHLSPETIAESRAKDLDLHLNRSGNVRTAAPYFRKQVKTEVTQIMETEGLDSKYDLYTDGLKVFTTLDSRMQRYAEKAVQEHLSQLQATFMSEFNKRGKPWEKQRSILKNAMKQTDRWRKGKAQGLSSKEIEASFNEKQEMRLWTWNGYRDTTLTAKDSLIHYITHLQTGFMSMDPHTGGIKAWVGGINYDKFKLDHVKQTKRQVGSTFKPIVYAAGMKELHKPCDQVLDIPVSIPLPDGKHWTPKNSGGKDDGLITYYEGLSRSKNQVTAYLMKELGPERVCEYARIFGIQNEMECNPSLCLGTADLTVYEMVSVYATFVNQGHYTKPYLVSRIEDKNGQVLYQHVPESREALDPNTAFTMVRMLQGVVDHLKGTGRRLRTRYKFKNQMGGKTGTTQGNSDGWFMGITPDLVSGTWVGCDDRRLRFRRTLYGQGANMALPIFAIYMKYVYADPSIGLSQGAFEPPKDYPMTPYCPAPKRKNLFDADGEGDDIDDWMDRLGG